MASERVAILDTIDQLPRGRPATENRQNFVDKNQVAILAGFGNRETARQARIVVERGPAELIAALDRGAVSISAAAAGLRQQPEKIARHPREKARPTFDAAEAQVIPQARAVMLTQMSRLLRVDPGKTAVAIVHALGVARSDIAPLPTSQRVDAGRGCLRALGVDAADLRPIG
jgi:hypothetical protein